MRERLSADDIYEVVTGVTYKIGWSFSVEFRVGEIAIRIERFQFDSDNVKVRVHEVAEWLRVDGERVLSPHGQASILKVDQYSTRHLKALLKNEAEPFELF